MQSTNVEKVKAKLLRYLETLIAFNTEFPPGHSTEIARYIDNEMRDMGYESAIYSSGPGLDNVVARVGKGTTSLVFNAHVDTVSAGNEALWSSFPYRATLRDGRVYGLGAANCKGSAAVQLWLARELINWEIDSEFEIVFTFVTDEESLDSGGMQYLRDVGIVKPSMLLLGAPTDNTLVVEERGVLWVNIVTLGKAAHAGQPEDGVNAIMRMVQLLDYISSELARRLQNRQNDTMRSTFSIGMINGGVNNNVVPSQCTAMLDRRLLPDERVDDAYQEIAEIVRSSGIPESTVSLEKLRGTNGFRGSRESTLVSALCGSIREVSGETSQFTSAIGVSDGRYFAGDGIEIVNFGPGTGAAGHAVDESVSVDALLESALILEHCTRKLIVHRPSECE